MKASASKFSCQEAKLGRSAALLARSIFFNSVWSFAILAGGTIAGYRGTAHAESAVGVEELKSDFLRENVKPENGEVSVNDLERAERKLRAAEEQLIQQSRQSGQAAEGAARSAAKNEAMARADIAKAEAANHAPAVVNGTGNTTSVSAAIPSTNSATTGTRVVAATAPLTTEQRNAELQRDLDSSTARVNELLKQLDETRNRLMIAETQVERLSSIIDGQNKTVPAAAKNMNIVSRNSMTVTSSSAVNPAGATVMARPANVVAAAAPRVEARATTDEDMQIATVVADKAHLRTGPGKDNSPLMAVSKGTRLAVETRSGDWYRVIAPTGMRAWVSSDVVAFGVGGRNNSPTQATRVKGFNAGLENETVAMR